MGDRPQLPINPELLPKLVWPWDPPPDFLLPHLDDKLRLEFFEIKLHVARNMHQASLDGIEKTERLLKKQTAGP